jgi:hypothetical protein
MQAKALISSIHTTRFPPRRRTIEARARLLRLYA